ncbi:glycosyltransferase family 9 protein [Bacteriovoracaceae bacterium]|nr:glycosyltransferase family 9 protein [Bacteriovoracaceae bacterium]
MLKVFKFVIFYLCDLLFLHYAKNPSHKKEKKQLLVVRTDAIGDYLMFRFFLQEIRRSKRFEDYEITLLGNQVWQQLTAEWDRLYVDHFIFCHPKSLNQNLIYRYKIFKRLAKVGFDTIINPLYSRVYYLDKGLSVLGAKHLIGIDGDNWNIETWQKKVSDRFYNHLFRSNNRIAFEYDRNLEFCQWIIQEEITPNPSHISLDLKVPKSLKEKFFQLIPFQEDNIYIYLFTGAGSPYKIWDIKNFERLANHMLTLSSKVHIVVMGDKSSPKIQSQNRIHSLIDKLPLHESILMAQYSNMIICNESMATHLGASLDKTVFCISNGNHYGRFLPYPEVLRRKVQYFLPPELTKDLKNIPIEEVIDRYHVNFNDINSIDYNDVQSQISTTIQRMLI